MSVNIWEGSKAQELIDAVNNKSNNLSDDAKLALLNCFKKVAWVDGNGQMYYDALAEALLDPTEKKPTLLYWDYIMGGNPTDAGFAYRGESGETSTKPSDLVESTTQNGLSIKTTGNVNRGYIVPNDIVIPAGYVLEIDYTINNYQSLTGWYGLVVYYKNCQTQKGEYISINSSGFCVGGSTRISYSPAVGQPHTIRISNDMLYCDGAAIFKVGIGSGSAFNGVCVASGGKDFSVILRRIAVMKE